MSNLTHWFKLGQNVKCNFDVKLHEGIFNVIYKEHIIVDIPDISDHCYFENGFNIGDVYPDYNF